MKEHLGPLLRCPQCGAELVLGSDALREQGEIKQGELGCPGGHRYPVTNFIPRFVDNDGYVRNFSFQWHIYREVQLDSVTGDGQTAKLFELMTHIKREDLDGRRVLDVGCGPGKFAEVALGMGAEVVGIDLSFAVDAALENFGLHPRLHLIQADVFHLPFAEGVFDAIYSLGVLHHTPDCEAAFKRLPRHLRPGGRVAIWVYAKEIVPHFNRRVKGITRRLPPRLLYWLALLPVPVTYIFNTPYLRAPFYALRPYFQWIAWGTWRQRWLDTFDWYACWYQSAHTYPEVHRWFKDEGLTDIEPGDIAVSMRGLRQ